jgi:hypothetical protein
LNGSTRKFYLTDTSLVAEKFTAAFPRLGTSDNIVEMSRQSAASPSFVSPISIVPGSQFRIWTSDYVPRIRSFCCHFLFLMINFQVVIFQGNF